MPLLNTLSKALPNYSDVTSASRRTRRLLDFFFCFSLAFELLFRIAGQRSWLLSNSWQSNYGITEWMINFQGGFVRRGLPGEILFAIGRHTRLDIGWLVLFLCLALYFIYFALMYHLAKGRFPLWALCSAPLLGYPIYAGDIIRKDVLLLLLLLFSAKFIAKSKISASRQFVIAGLAIAGLLSHESYLFFGVPICCSLDFLLSWKSLGRLGSLSKISVWSLAWLPPFAVAGFTLENSGSDLIAAQILDSWRSLAPVAEQKTMLSMALSWLGKSPSYTIEATHKLLSLTHFGIPLWLLVGIALSVGGVAIALLFAQREDRERFALFFVVQLVLMMPIFFSTLDQGRWIFLTINSAFIISLSFSNHRIPIRLNVIGNWAERIRRVVPPSFCVLALSVWGFPVSISGFPHVGYSLRGWIVGIPLFLVPSRIYFYLKINNVVTPLF